MVPRRLLLSTIANFFKFVASFFLVLFIFELLEVYFWKDSIPLNPHSSRDREYSYKKPENIFRILVLGDSQTLGLGIKDVQHTWHKKLETKMNLGLDQPKFEIITLAGQGWNTDTQLYELFGKGIKYNPDLILLGFNHDDVPAPSSTKCYDSDIKFFPDSKIINWFRNNSKIYKLIEPRLNRLFDKLEHRPEYADCVNKRFESLGWFMEEIYLDTILKFAQIKNIHFMLTTLPLLNKLGDDYPLKKAHMKIKAYCKKREIECLDLYFEGFKGLNASSVRVSITDPHFNEAGTEIAAQSLFKRLKSLKEYRYLSKFSAAFDLNELLNQKQLVKKTDQNFNKLEDNETIKFISGNEKLEIKKKDGNLHFLDTVLENKKSTTYKIILNEKGGFKESEIIFHKENDSNTYFAQNKFKDGKNFVSGGTLKNREKIEATNKIFSLRYLIEGSFQRLEIEQEDFFRDPKVFENTVFTSAEPSLPIVKFELEKYIFDNLSYFFIYKSFFNSLEKEILNKKPSKTAIRALGKLYLAKKNFSKFEEIQKNNPSVIFHEYKFEETSS